MKKALTWLRIGVLVAAVLAVVVFVLYRCHVFVFDDSAVVSGNGIEWNGARYVPCEGKYTLGAAFAKMAGDDARVLYAVKGDGAHNFLVAKAMRDPQLYVREDMAVPKEGELSAVFVEAERMSDPALLSALDGIFSKEMPLCDGDLLMKEAKSISDIWFCFDGCPVGGVKKGMIASGDKWYAVRHDGGQFRALPLTDEQAEVLEPFVEPSFDGRMLWMCAVIAGVVTVLILARKKSKENT